MTGKQSQSDQSNTKRYSRELSALRAALKVTQAVRRGEMSPNALEAVERRLEKLIEKESTDGA